jgi:WD40 repeat protein
MAGADDPIRHKADRETDVTVSAPDVAGLQVGDGNTQINYFYYQGADRLTNPPGTWAVRQPRAHHTHRKGLRRGRRTVIVAACAVMVAAGGATAAYLTNGKPTHPVTLAATLSEPDGAALCAAAFEPKGNLVTVDRGGKAYTWNVATRQSTMTAFSSVGFTSCALSPDGRTAVGIGVQGIETTDADSGIFGDISPSSSLSANSFSAISAGSGALSSNGFLVCTDTSQNESVDVLNLNKQSEVGTLVAGGPISALSISSDSRMIAASYTPGYTYVWSVPVSGILAKSGLSMLVSPDGARIISSAFNADGKVLITGDSRRGKANTYIWSIAKGLIATLPSPNSSAATSVALNPTGTLAATADGNTISIWNVTTGKIIATVTDPPGTSISTLAFSQDSTRLAAASNNGST